HDPFSLRPGAPPSPTPVPTRRSSELSGAITGSVTNKATASGAFSDPASTTASANAQATVVGHVCTISLTKTPDKTSVCNGTSVTYTYVVTNNSDAFTWTSGRTSGTVRLHAGAAAFSIPAGQTKTVQASSAVEGVHGQQREPGFGDEQGLRLGCVQRSGEHDGVGERAGDGGRARLHDQPDEDAGQDLGLQRHLRHLHVRGHQQQ